MSRRFPLPNLTVVLFNVYDCRVSSSTRNSWDPSSAATPSRAPRIMRRSPSSPIPDETNAFSGAARMEPPAPTQNKKRRLVRLLWPHVARCRRAHSPRFRERNKQFHTGPELSHGNSGLALVQANVFI